MGEQIKALTDEQLKSVFAIFVNMNAKSFAGWTTEEIRDEYNRMGRHQLSAAQVERFMSAMEWVEDDEQKVWFRKPFADKVAVSDAIKELIAENPKAHPDALMFLRRAAAVQRKYEQGESDE